MPATTQVEPENGPVLDKPTRPHIALACRKLRIDATESRRTYPHCREPGPRPPSRDCGAPPREEPAPGTHAPPAFSFAPIHASSAMQAAASTRPTDSSMLRSTSAVRFALRATESFVGNGVVARQRVEGGGGAPRSPAWQGAARNFAPKWALPLQGYNCSGLAEHYTATRRPQSCQAAGCSGAETRALWPPHSRASAGPERRPTPTAPEAVRNWNRSLRVPSKSEFSSRSEPQAPIRCCFATRLRNIGIKARADGGRTLRALPAPWL